MYPTPAKLAEDEFAVYTLSASSTRILAFYCNLPTILQLIIIFDSLPFTLNPFDSNASF